MAEESEKYRIRRIVVALHATEQCRSTVETAVLLAARLEAEMVGLFIEDINLLRLAALPFARELGYGSTRRRALDTSHMERSLRIQAETLKKQLSACAGHARIPWSFQVRRGELLEELLQMASQADLVVIGGSAEAIISSTPEHLSRRVLLQCSCAVLKQQGRHHRLERPVVLFYDGSAECRHALALAAQLAGGQEQQLHILLPPGDEAARRRLEKQALELLQEAAPQARFEGLPDLRATTLARAVEAVQGDILITGAALPLDDRQQLESLLDEIHCNLLLVR